MYELIKQVHDNILHSAIVLHHVKMHLQTTQTNTRVATRVHPHYSQDTHTHTQTHTQTHTHAQCLTTQRQEDERTRATHPILVKAHLGVTGHDRKLDAAG